MNNVPKYKKLYKEQMELTWLAQEGEAFWKDKALTCLAALVAVLITSTLGLGILGYVAKLALWG